MAEKVDKLAENGGKPHGSWTGKKGAGPLPTPAELATWTSASQESFYLQRVAFWNRQTMKTCLQVRKVLWFEFLVCIRVVTCSFLMKNHVNLL
jgi:hypothetical protein|eukprot:COSAG06_NODE_5208_length_3637_cov_91.168739_3_plen_93_part_00